MIFNHKLLILLFVALVAAVAVPAQAPSANSNGIAEMYLAKDDGSGGPGETAIEFLPTDIPIYCVVQLSLSIPTTVKMNLVAVKVLGVKPETRVVSTSYETKDRQDRVDFTGRPVGQWVAGKYRVDVFINGTQAASREFTVVAARPRSPKPAASEAASPKSSAAARPIVRRPRRSL